MAAMADDPFEKVSKVLPSLPKPGKTLWPPRNSRRPCGAPRIDMLLVNRHRLNAYLDQQVSN